MSVDFLPNTWRSPTQMATAQAQAERRARLFNSPPPKVVMMPIPAAPPVVEVEPVVEPEPAPVEVAAYDYPRRPTAQSVMRGVCVAREIRVEDMVSGRHFPALVRARHECFYLMRKYVRWRGHPISLSAIARVFALHHTTVMWGIEQHKRRMAGEIE